MYWKIKKEIAKYFECEISTQEPVIKIMKKKYQNWNLI